MRDFGWYWDNTAVRTNSSVCCFFFTVACSIEWGAIGILSIHIYLLTESSRAEYSYLRWSAWHSQLYCRKFPATSTKTASILDSGLRQTLQLAATTDQDKGEREVSAQLSILRRLRPHRRHRVTHATEHEPWTALQLPAMNLISQVLRKQS